MLVEVIAKNPKILNGLLLLMEDLFHMNVFDGFR